MGVGQLFPSLWRNFDFHKLPKTFSVFIIIMFIIHFFRAGEMCCLERKERECERDQERKRNLLINTQDSIDPLIFFWIHNKLF